MRAESNYLFALIMDSTHLQLAFYDKESEKSAAVLVRKEYMYISGRQRPSRLRASNSTMKADRLVHCTHLYWVYGELLMEWSYKYTSVCLSTRNHQNELQTRNQTALWENLIWNTSCCVALFSTNRSIVLLFILFISTVLY